MAGTVASGIDYANSGFASVGEPLGNYLAGSSLAQPFLSATTSIGNYLGGQYYNFASAHPCVAFGISAGVQVAGLLAAPEEVGPELVGGDVEEGIYVIRGARGTYVGQSGNMSARLASHVRTGRFTQSEVDAAQRVQVLGGKTAREIAEQQRIDAFGGIQNLLNKRNPIGTARIHLMGNDYAR